MADVSVLNAGSSPACARQNGMVAMVTHRKSTQGLALPGNA
jgi:hypothetical protein